MALISFNGKSWLERVDPQYSKAEQGFLRKFGDSPQSLTKAARVAELRARAMKVPSSEDIAAVESLCQQHIPEGAVLIYADITLPEGTGILNVESKGDRIQIRI